MVKLIRVIILFAVLIQVTSAVAVERRTLVQPYTVVQNDSSIAVAIFDADGTLRPALGPGAPVNSPNQVVLLPDVAAKIRELNAKNYFVAIASNQAGIPRHARFDHVEAALARTVELLAAEGAVVHYFDFAEHWDENRKPRAGMGVRIEEFLLRNYGKPVDRARSMMVGDAAWAGEVKGSPPELRPDGRPGFNHSNADRKFAENFGISFVEAAEFFGWRANYGIDVFEEMKDLKAFYEARPGLRPTIGCEHLLK